MKEFVCSGSEPKYNTLSIVNAHAPTEAKDESTKDEFYAILQGVFDDIPSHDVKVIMRDCNAEVGREIIYQGRIGKHSLHDMSNDNGRRLIDFSISKNLVNQFYKIPT